MQRGQIVLVDTNIVIEAFRSRCWKTIANYYRIETVEKCLEEVSTGDRLRPGYVEVDPALLEEKLVVNRASAVASSHRLLAGENGLSRFPRPVWAKQE